MSATLAILLAASGSATPMVLLAGIAFLALVPLLWLVRRSSQREGREVALMLDLRFEPGGFGDGHVWSVEGRVHDRAVRIVAEGDACRIAVGLLHPASGEVPFSLLTKNDIRLPRCLVDVPMEATPGGLEVILPGGRRPAGQIAAAVRTLVRVARVVDGKRARRLVDSDELAVVG